MLPYAVCFVRPVWSVAHVRSVRFRLDGPQSPFLADAKLRLGLWLWRLRAVSDEDYDRFWTKLIREVAQGRTKKGVSLFTAVSVTLHKLSQQQQHAVKTWSSPRAAVVV